MSKKRGTSAEAQKEVSAVDVVTAGSEVPAGIEYVAWQASPRSAKTQYSGYCSMATK
jgi:hypothetical protein